MFNKISNWFKDKWEFANMVYQRDKQIGLNYNRYFNEARKLNKKNNEI